MIGIESVNPESLKEMNKKQNIGISAKDAIQKIQSYGMAVLAHMIIGTDADNKDVFSNTADFITETGIVQHICHPLAAPLGTKMWYDFKRQGRLVSFSHDLTSDKMDIITNVIPMQMSRTELFNGLADYWDDIYSPEKYKDRAIKYIKGMERKPKVKPPGLKTLWSYRKTISGVFSYFLFKAGKKHRSLFFHLLRTAGSSISYLMPKVIFMYTFYLIDLKRSKYDSEMARQHAIWESEHPENIVPDTTDVPLNDHIRSNAALLVETAYKYLRQKSASKELIYKSVLAGMMEFNNRFGHQLDAFDEFYTSRLQECCEREYPQIASSLNEPPAEMPEKIPSGFTREIMDALDNSIRYQKVFST